MNCAHLELFWTRGVRLDGGFWQCKSCGTQFDITERKTRVERSSIIYPGARQTDSGQIIALVTEEPMTKNNPESFEKEFTFLNCAAFDMHWRTLARKGISASMWLVKDEESKQRIQQEFVDAFNQRISDRRNELAGKAALSREDETELSALLINNWFPLTLESAEAYLQSLPRESLADKISAWKEFELAQLASREAGNETSCFVPDSIVTPLIKSDEPEVSD